jgi:integrase/recombinase XerD
MFNILFQYPRLLARHRQAPSAQARERYLTHRADQRAARDTLLRTARESGHRPAPRPHDRSDD